MVGLHSGRVGASYNMPRAFYDLYIIIVYTVVIQWSLPSSSALSCPKQLPTELFTLDFIDWEEPWTNWMMMQQFQNSISGTMGLKYFFMGFCFQNVVIFQNVLLFSKCENSVKGFVRFFSSFRKIQL